MRPLVSVVTPFHNTVEYLRECIESVLSQTYSDLEYILVDNASNDGSSEVAQELAARDSRIRVVTTDRLLAQVENYNFACSQISRDSVYCKICQADDWLFPRCLEEMVDLAERAPSVGLVSAYSSYGREITLTGLAVDRSIVDGKEICRRYFTEGLSVFGSPTAVMYRSSWVRSRQPFFEQGRLYEDVELCFEVLLESDFGFVHQVLTFMRLRDESIMGQLADFMSAPLEFLMHTERFAGELMSVEEWEALRRKARNEYYESLGKWILRSAVSATPPGFWEYQRHGLDLVGLRLSSRRVALGVAASAVKMLLSPLSTVEKARSLRRPGK